MIYNTITQACQYQQKILRSQFICFLFPISDTQQARSILSEHSHEYANATHNCFAYIIGLERETQYYSDAGEPHGTAGKPILNALLRNNLTNVLAIVTRYYGGIKLGVKGLIDAYGDTVEKATKEACTTPARLYCSYNITVEYALGDVVSGKIKSLQGEITESQWSQQVTFTIRLPQENQADLLRFLDGQRQHSHLEYQQVK